MKKIIMGLMTISSILTNGQGTTTIYSNNNNYSVTVTLSPVGLVVPSSCQYGYNFNVAIDYDIVFTGSAPASMHVLQATLQCGDKSLFFNLPNSPASGTLVTTANPWNNNSDCSTATVQTLDCSIIILHINGPGMSNQFVTIDVSTTLPIELVDFSLENKDEAVYVNWTTASEKDNDYFTVEKSSDAQNWEEIGKVTGAGNSVQDRNYQIKDENPYNGISYYRLKQTDFNGETTYFDTKSIEITNTSQIKIA